MERTMLGVNFPNFVSVVVMWLLSFVAVALIAQGVQRFSGGSDQ